jgi:hypothetical protein
MTESEAIHLIQDGAARCGLPVPEARAAVKSAFKRPPRESTHKTNGSEHPGRSTLSPEQRQRIQTERVTAALKVRARSSLKTILREHSWTAADAWEISPVRLCGDPAGDWRLLLSLFNHGDVLWIGDTKDSCDEEADDRRKAYCRRHFRPVADWRKESSAPAQFTCPSAFNPGVHSRSNENVLKRRYLVVESDTLTKDQITSVFKWCRQFMELRAIVDTAGKSLHGWFDYPDPDVVEELKAILPQLGCDPALFKASQPCRLPGARRDDRTQALVWFGGGSE